MGVRRRRGYVRSISIEEREEAERTGFAEIVEFGFGVNEEIVEDEGLAHLLRRRRLSCPNRGRRWLVAIDHSPFTCRWGGQEMRCKISRATRI